MFVLKYLSGYTLLFVLCLSSISEMPSVGCNLKDVLPMQRVHWFHCTKDQVTCSLLNLNLAPTTQREQMALQPLSIPLLPVSNNGTPWPASVEAAFQFICSKFNHANCLLQLDDGDVAQLGVLKNSIETECLTILEDLEQWGLAADFIDRVMESLAAMLVRLDQAAQGCSNQ
jgi:hypothetical protein